MSVASAASVPRIVKKSLTWSIVLSILMIVAGLLSIIVPLIAGIVVTVFVGWLLVFSAGAHFVFACTPAPRAGQSGRYWWAFFISWLADTC